MDGAGFLEVGTARPRALDVNMPWMTPSRIRSIGPFSAKLVLVGVPAIPRVPTAERRQRGEMAHADHLTELTLAKFATIAERRRPYPVVTIRGIDGVIETDTRR